MDDVELDRALRAALSVEPSPEFVARVRTTIAEAPRPSMVAGWLRPATAVACAALVVMMVALPREHAIAPSTAGLKPSTTYVGLSGPSVVVPTFSPPVALAKGGRSAQSAKPLTRSRVAMPQEPSLPEVLIAQKDVEALREFIASANEVRFTASFDETPAPTEWVITEMANTQAHNN